MSDYIDPTNLNVQVDNPNPAGDPIQLKLMDEYWSSGEAMPPIVDVFFENMVKIERYRASQVKKIGKLPVGQVESQGGQWGVLRFRPGGSVKDKIHQNPLFGSDPLIIEALGLDLYNDDGELIIPAGEAYGQHGRILRAWVYQELREVTAKGSWVFVSTTAVWSIGPWNILDIPEDKAGEKLLAPADGNRDQTCSSAFFLNPDNIAGDWTIQASFRDIIWNFFNIFFAPEAFVQGSFTGPLNGFPGIPHNGDVYVGRGTLILTASYRPDPITGVNYDYNCGNVEWEATWRWVGP